MGAVIAGMSIIVTSTQAIAQPTIVPETTNKNVKEIQAVIEPQEPAPTNNDVARAQIDQRAKELALQRQQEEDKKKQEEQEQIKAATTVQTAKVAQVSAQTPKVSYNVEQWRPIIAKYPWPVDQAMLTMSLESGGNPRAISRTDDHGLFQIHGGYAKYGEKIYDPEFNISLAYNNYYKGRGWTPWYAVRGILW